MSEQEQQSTNEQADFAARVKAELDRISSMDQAEQIEALKSLHALLENALDEGK